MPRTSVSIDLTNEERYELERNVKSQKVEKRLYIRSRIILLAAQGLESTEIAKMLEITEKTCHKWRNRFIKNRLKGIQDLERCGAPEAFSEQERLAIIKLSCSEPPIPRNWTLAYLTEEAIKLIGRPISVETVRQILKSANSQTIVMFPSRHQIHIQPSEKDQSGKSN